MGVWGVRGSMGEYGQLLRNLGQQKWSSNKSKKHLTSLQIVNVTAGKCCAVVIVISEISVKSKLAECGKGGPKQPRYSLIPIITVIELSSSYAHENKPPRSDKNLKQLLSNPNETRFFNYQADPVVGPARRDLSNATNYWPWLQD